MAITEFIVPGTPISSGASGRSRTRWKNAVSEAAVAALPDKHALVADSVRVTIVYFYVSTDLDLDNIIKPILDALETVVYLDDEQVKRVTSERFNLHDISKIINPSPLLAAALENYSELLHIVVHIPED